MGLVFLGGDASVSSNDPAVLTVPAGGIPVGACVVCATARAATDVPILATDTRGNVYNSGDGGSGADMRFAFQSTSALGIMAAMFHAIVTTELQSGDTISTGAPSFRGVIAGWWYNLPRYAKPSTTNPYIGADTSLTSDGEGRGSGTAITPNLQTPKTSWTPYHAFGWVVAASNTTFTRTDDNPWVASGGPYTVDDNSLRAWPFHMESVRTADRANDLRGTLGASFDWELLFGQYGTYETRPVVDSTPRPG